MMNLKIIIILSLIILSILIYYANNIYIERQIEDARTKINILKKNKDISEDFIDFPKYYINLDRSEERRKNMNKEINDYGLKNIKRIKAFDGRQMEDIKEGEIDGYKYGNHRCKKIRKSQLAVTMSHLKAIATAKKDKNDYAIILEDDVEMTLVPHWNYSITEIIDKLPKVCDILLLSNDGKGKNLKIIDEKEKFNGRCGVAYLVTPSGFEKLSKFLVNNSFDFQSYKNVVWDQEIMDNLNIYHTDKTLFLQFNFKFSSENDKKHENQIYCSTSHDGLLKYF